MIHDSGQVPLEHLLLSWYPSQRDFKTFSLCAWKWYGGFEVGARTTEGHVVHAVFSATMEKKYLVFDGSRVNSNDDPAIGGQARFIHCLLGKGELY